MSAFQRVSLMPVPPYQDLLQPILRILSSEGEELSKDRLVERLAVELALNGRDAQERLPSGSGTVLEHNVDWARSHLQMQGLIEGSLERGLRLTAKGWSYAGKVFSGDSPAAICHLCAGGRR
jgi:restriction endonuclease Mrr